MPSRTPTLDYLTDARRRGANGHYGVSPSVCRCDICEQRMRPREVPDAQSR